MDGSNLSVDSDFPYVSYVPLFSYVPIKFITLCNTCNTTPTPCYSVTLLHLLHFSVCEKVCYASPSLREEPCSTWQSLRDVRDERDKRDVAIICVVRIIPYVSYVSYVP